MLHSSQVLPDNIGVPFLKLVDLNAIVENDESNRDFLGSKVSHLGKSGGTAGDLPSDFFDGTALTFLE